MNLAQSNDCIHPKREERKTEREIERRKREEREEGRGEEREEREDAHAKQNLHT